MLGSVITHHFSTCTLLIELVAEKTNLMPNVVALSIENVFGALGGNLVTHLYWFVACLAVLVVVDSHPKRNWDDFTN